MQEYREAAEEFINPRAQTKNRRKKSCGFGFKFNYLNFLLRAASDFFFLLTEGFS